MINYISISEFAKKAGVSRQTIYNRLDKDLKPYLQIIDNQKKLDIRALELFKKENDCQEECQENDKQFTTLDKDLTSALQADFDLLNRTISILETELNEKNSRINDLMEENRKLNESLRSLSEKAGNALQAMTQTQLADKIINYSDNHSAVDMEEEKNNDKGRTWIGRLFKKRNKLNDR